MPKATTAASDLKRRGPPQVPSFKVPKNLAKMRANPKNNWQIKDLEAVGASIGLSYRMNSGSHCTFSSPYLMGHQTIPAKRPIKPVYVRSFVSLCDAHIEAQKEISNQGGTH